MLYLGMSRSGQILGAILASFAEMFVLALGMQWACKDLSISQRYFRRTRDTGSLLVFECYCVNMGFVKASYGHVG